MANDIVRRDERDDDTGMNVMDLARVLAESNEFPDLRKSIAKAAVRILAGREIGIGPIASIQGIFMQNGKPVYSSNTLAAIVKRNGYNYRILRLDNDACELQAIDRDGTPLEPVVSFGKEDAERAKLTHKDTYRQYPRNMFFNRAMSNMVRWHFPHLFMGGAYTPDELGDSGGYDGVTVDGEIIDDTEAVEQARGVFYDAVEEVIGGRDWASVQAYFNWPADAPENEAPLTVDGWRALYEAVAKTVIGEEEQE